MPTLTEQYSKTYNSFSGCDIHATFGGVRIGEIQGISFTVMREKAPLYTMGSSDCRGYSRGKRGISGSLIFLMFDRSALLQGMNRRGMANIWTSTDNFTQAKGRRDFFLPKLKGDAGSGSTDIGSGIVEDVPAWYPDQIPPFTIVLNAINEYGHRASMYINGVEILNHGSGISIDDITIDESMTFVCTEIIPWQTGAFISPGSATINPAAGVGTIG